MLTDVILAVPALQLLALSFQTMAQEYIFSLLTYFPTNYLACLFFICAPLGTWLSCGSYQISPAVWLNS